MIEGRYSSSNGTIGLKIIRCQPNWLYNITKLLKDQILEKEPFRAKNLRYYDFGDGQNL